MDNDKLCHDFLQQHLIYDNFPVVVLGAGGSTLPMKFHAVMFAMWLESGVNQNSFCKYADEIVSGTYDLGVEFSLPKVQPIDISRLFPWMPEDSQPERPCSADPDDFEILEQMQVAVVPKQVSLNKSLGIPGLLHIIHNAASSLLTVCSKLGEQIDSLGLVCKLLAGQDCTKLLETCYTGPVGQMFHTQLQRFSFKLYEGRWGSVAFCVSEVLKLKTVLQYGWSLEKYLDGSRPQTEILKVDEALTSSFWWSALLVLDKLYGLVRSCFAWAEGCPCHSHLNWQEVDAQTRKRWSSCPLRGLRFPEVCAGDFFSMFASLQMQEALDLASTLADAVTEEERNALLRDFEIGRGHMLYVFTLKVGPFTAFPLRLGAIAHHCRSTAHDAMRSCLASTDGHPLMKQFRSEPVHSEVLQHLEGEDLANCPNLAIFLARFKFALVVERRIEGGHARIQRKGRGASYRGEAYDSLALRMTEIRRETEGKPEFLEDLSVLLDKARSPRRMVEALGLQFHPALQRETHAWSKVYRLVAYRADKWTLYRSGPPPVEISPSDMFQDPDDDSTGALQDISELEDAVALGPANRNNVDNNGLLQEAAVAYFVSQLRQFEQTAPRLFVARVPSGSLVTLMSRVQGKPAQSLADELQHPLTDWMTPKGLMCFSVVAANPSRAKTANKGMLAPTDVAIAVHQVIKVEKMRGYVASTPLSVSSSAAFSVAPEKVPLVLTAGVFDLTTLQTAIAWEFSPDICYAISMDGRMHVDSSMSRLLQQLVATPGGLQLDRSSLAEHQDQLALLKD